MPEIFGKQVSKGTVAIGAGAAGLLGVALYRARKQQAADKATAAANAAAQAPGTGTGTSDQIDPATGFPYGSAEDASALTSQAGYVSPIGGLGGSNQSYNYGGGYPLSGGFTSNSQWAQAAEQYLVETGGQTSDSVGNAMGKYITGQAVSDPSQMSIINQAIAFEGYPPVPGPDGYPPSIRTGAVGTTVPPVSNGQSTVSGGHVIHVNNNDASVGWTAHGPATQWQVRIQGPNLNGRTNVVSIPQASFSGMAAGHNYQVFVTPWANGKAAGPTGEVHFATSRGR